MVAEQSREGGWAEQVDFDLLIYGIYFYSWKGRRWQNVMEGDSAAQRRHIPSENV